MERVPALLVKSASGLGGFVGQLFQTEQREEEAVVLKLVRFVDPLHSGNQKKQQQQNQIKRVKLTAVRSRSPEALKAAAKIQLVAKSLNQEQTTIVGQTVRFEGKLQ